MATVLTTHHAADGTNMADRQNSGEFERTGPSDYRPSDLEELFAELCELYPKRWVEIVNGRIVVSPVPRKAHCKAEYAMYKLLMPVAEERGWELWHGIYAFLGPQRDRYMPDIAVVPAEPPRWSDDHAYANAFIMIVEVVSPSSVDDDHVNKPLECGRGGVPLYLVVDTIEGVVRLLSGPPDAGYTRETKVRLGEAVHLPEPFAITLDTAPLLPLQDA